jgi:hypothetical protein
VSAAAKTLAQALVAFHAEAPAIPNDRTNPHFNSKFASLAGIMEAIRPVLAKHGLAVVQQPEDGGLRTWILHESGEERDCGVIPLAVDKPGPQAQGSALTYARRYGVLAALGLVGDDDDDANAASPTKKSTEFKAPPAKKASASHVNEITTLTEALILAGKLTADVIASQMAAEFGTANPKELTQDQAENLIKRLTAKAGGS